MTKLSTLWLTSVIVKCPRCAAKWTGQNTCHCAACHITFSGYTAFDVHRSGSHARGERHCLTMEKAGLVDAGRGYECWTIPGKPETEEEDVLL